MKNAAPLDNSIGAVFDLNLILDDLLRKLSMNTKSKTLMVVASLLLLLLFVSPLWKISLFAPQYPDGLKMYLNIDGISDGETNDIANINIMNHYVGMKQIHEDDFKEFTYMPYIVVGLIVLGLLVTLIKKRSLILGWLVCIAVLGVLGLYIFYMWEYDYGHNLDPRAPIKIPGAAYQPPLIGTKKILNFTVHSYPHIGAFVIGISMAITSFAWVVGKKK